MQGIRPRSSFISVLAALVGIGLASATGGVVLAHDDLAGSVPEHQAVLDAPISEVTIDFGEAVEGVELGLIGPNDEQLPGEVTVMSDTEAKLTFDELTVEGEYLVRYLAEEDGHLVAGAISFVYGSRDATGAGATTWILFGLAAAAILAVGAFFTLRRSRVGAVDGDSDIGDETGGVATA